MLTAHRCHEHRLWDGETYLDVDGARIPDEFRFPQGLRKDHSAALATRPDLAPRLWHLGLWGASEEDLDAAVEALLTEDAQAQAGAGDPTTALTSPASR